MSLLLTQADARHLPFADGSVQCCIASPPYWGLRDYGTSGQLGLEPTPDAYVQNMVQVFREVWRVLRDDGVCWLNLGDSFASTNVIERPLSTSGNRDTRGVPYGSTMKSRTESTARKSLGGLKPKDLVGIPWRVAFALQADGWYLRSDVIWSKPNPMPESVTDRPTKSHEYVFLLTKSARYFWDADAVREPLSQFTAQYLVKDWGRNDSGKIAPERKDAGTLRGTLRRDQINQYGRNLRSVWHIATQPYPGAHFATMPEKLVERCVLAGSKAGDVILDPFMGSGTVARVALRFGRKAIGCDLNPAYLKLADARTRVTYGLPLEGEDVA
jgi:DNA modification methylase